jgi:hypothetical protein
MSNEDFLSRWSRRKRVAEAAPESLPSSPVSGPPSAGEDEAPVVDSEAGKSVKEPDLSALPPLDTITAATDVTAFLRKGVPLALTREALRRAWAADPAIRDFVGLAENAWDFNDPTAMPGFGPLDYTEEQVRDLVARIVRDKWSLPEDDDASHAALPLQQNAAVPADLSGHSMIADTAAADSEESSARQVEAEISVAQNPSSVQAAPKIHDESLSVVRRTHGRALPR